MRAVVVSGDRKHHTAFLDAGKRRIAA